MICAGCGREDILCPTCTGVPSPLEQRIRDRIKELEPMLNHDNWCGLTATRIDELRKLLK